MTKQNSIEKEGRRHNSQFVKMAGKRLQLNAFGKLKVRSSIEVYRLKFATSASWSNVMGKAKEHNLIKLPT